MAQADANTAQTASGAQKKSMSDAHRNAWILTGYGIFGLFLLGLIAYSVAEYAVR